MAGVVTGSRRIGLVVSDIDGTMVTGDKVLTDENIAAARRLEAAGIRLSLVSSRPPAGFAMLAGPLALDGPIGAFNGGAILNPDLSPIEETFVPAEAARIALEAFAACGLDAWLFTRDTWFATRADSAYVAKERRTIRHEPTIVAALDDLPAGIGKLVGSSADFEAVARCEAALGARLGTLATARRSQPYYLDVTPHGFDKGEAVRRIARRLAVPLDEVAVIGDQANDLPMFAVAGTRIAMGNAIEELKAQADYVTLDNEHSGVAAAIDRFILSQAGHRP